MQNEIINACNEIILKKIIEKVNASRCFSVIADETADISSQEQVSICVRFVDEDGGKKVVVENFLQFVPVESTRGEDLANTILDTLESLGLDLKYMRGQGYDGAAAMSGIFNGVQAKVREKFPSALYVHCASHSLNLAISDACKIKDIRNCMGVIEKSYSFMNTPKRNYVFRDSISKLCPSSRRETLKKLCPTRWIDRHESVMIMVELLKPLVHALEAIENWHDKDSSSGVYILLSSLKNSSFVIALLTIAKIFSYTLPLCRILQSKSIDLTAAVQLSDDILKELEMIRQNSERAFSAIYAESATILKQMIDDKFEMSIPRVASRQICRYNITTESAEDYFRISIFNQFLDATILHLTERFVKHKTVLNSLNILIPLKNELHLQPGYEKKLETLLDTYSTDLSDCSVSTLTAEYELWKRKLQQGQNIISAIEALQVCNITIFPNIYKLLKILITLPVTTCTAERSFTTLKYLKNYLRNSTSERRLNGLCLLYIYKNNISVKEEVLNILQQKEKRRMNINL